MNDLISRTQAIDAIVNKVSGIGLHDNSEVARYGATFRQHEIIDIIKSLPSVQSETNCSEIPNNSDLISRTQAIDAVSRGCQEFRGIFAECEKNLNELPSAQPEPSKKQKQQESLLRDHCCEYKEQTDKLEDGDELDEAIKIAEENGKERIHDWMPNEWGGKRRKLASWLCELKRLRTEVYFLKAEKENESVDLLGDVPCKTCKWRVTTTEKCEECIDGVSDNYEVQEPCEDAVSREAVTDVIRHSDIFSTWYEMDDIDDIVAEVIDEARKQLVDDVNELPSVTPKCPECDDVVSRRAAIDVAENAFVRGLLASPDIRKLPSVQPKSCEDAVSRDSVKFLLCKETCHPGAFCPDGFCREICEKVDALPSATQKQRMVEWIPVSERLPEKYGNYLISIHGENEPDIGTINPNDKRGWSLCDANGFYWARDKELIVTAWMPLPEPYRAERRTDEGD